MNNSTYQVNAPDRDIIQTLAEKLRLRDCHAFYDTDGRVIHLSLDSISLRDLPIEIGLLTGLTELNLRNNRLTRFPEQIGNLTALSVLNLGNNYLRELPPTVGRLCSLRELRLDHNYLSSLPHEIGQLAGLERLYLGNNYLTELPREVGQLFELTELYLQGTFLTELPPQMSRLENLEVLDLDFTDNHLISPPPEIIRRGIAAIITYLRELSGGSRTRYEAKLLLVGEGGTGKSSLLRSLRGESFRAGLKTTHGIEINSLILPHPEKKQAEITLNTWDFGGQHVYHATHQFFLTHRSLYLVVWNARLGADQGRLVYWLDTIQALAPDSPILLVATHIDERSPDLNFPALIRAYPQLVDSLSISNKRRSQDAPVWAAICLEAAQLPLMGQPWPATWVAAEQALLTRPEHHLDAGEYFHCCATHGVDEETAKNEFARYLHDLGKILYFVDDDVLCNIIVLKPNWVTNAIARVLDDPKVEAAQGILRHTELSRIWHRKDAEGISYPRELYPGFLRLMEKFDLSVQIEADVPGQGSTRSLIPQLLPHEPPKDLPLRPEAPPNGPTQVKMVYRLNFVPSGTIPWFIVRTHRYTTNRHWRDGVMLEYENHWAHVELNRGLREIHVLVWGPQPYNFFTIIKNTLDLILERFQGLRVEREVPCICHWEHPTTQPCPRTYLYEDLISRMELGRSEIECPNPPFIQVSVPTLLYGIHLSTDRDVMRDIRVGIDELKMSIQGSRDDILERLVQQSELIARNFTREWNLEMAKMGSEYPSTFLLMPWSDGAFNPKNWVSQEYSLYLMCQHPSGPHIVGEGYSIRQSEKWWARMSPWLNVLIKFLKFGVPLGHSVGTAMDEMGLKDVEKGLTLMEKITTVLPTLPDLDNDKGVMRPELAVRTQVAGAALRALHSFLREADAAGDWGGLDRTLTPDGSILWLCDKHREEYKVAPLNI